VLWRFVVGPIGSALMIAAGKLLLFTRYELKTGGGGGFRELACVARSQARLGRFRTSKMGLSRARLRVVGRYVYS